MTRACIRPPCACRFLWRALALVAVYLLFDALGWREYTSILSGTLPEPGMSFLQAKLMATVYLSAYLMAWLLAPIYVLSGVIRMFFLRVRRAPTGCGAEAAKP